jgi:hypothetical protein
MSLNQMKPDLFRRSMFGVGHWAFAWSRPRMRHPRSFNLSSRKNRSAHLNVEEFSQWTTTAAGQHFQRSAAPFATPRPLALRQSTSQSLRAGQYNSPRPSPWSEDYLQLSSSLAYMPAGIEWAKESSLAPQSSIGRLLFWQIFSRCCC